MVKSIAQRLGPLKEMHEDMVKKFKRFNWYSALYVFELEHEVY